MTGIYVYTLYLTSHPLPSHPRPIFHPTNSHSQTRSVITLLNLSISFVFSLRVQDPVKMRRWKRRCDGSGSWGRCRGVGWYARRALLS
ncbi:hypothetical protein BDQ17DRAFT_1371547 [Cyathus striatus]|nr:hypothetical protein BDQ17DRAFT_1371547 [Cyathus striatus]